MIKYDIKTAQAYINGEDIEFYGKLDDLETILSSAGFFRVHQSYLVNDKYVNSISRDKIVVNNEYLQNFKSICR